MTTEQAVRRPPRLVWASVAAMAMGSLLLLFVAPLSSPVRAGSVDTHEAAIEDEPPADLGDPSGGPSRLDPFAGLTLVASALAPSLSPLPAPDGDAGAAPDAGGATERDLVARVNELRVVRNHMVTRRDGRAATLTSMASVLAETGSAGLMMAFTSGALAPGGTPQTLLDLGVLLDDAAALTLAAVGDADCALVSERLSSFAKGVRTLRASAVPAHRGGTAVQDRAHRAMSALIESLERLLRPALDRCGAPAGGTHTAPAPSDDDSGYDSGALPAGSLEERAPAPGAPANGSTPAGTGAAPAGAAGAGPAGAGSAGDRPALSRTPAGSDVARQSGTSAQATVVAEPRTHQEVNSGTASSERVSVPGTATAVEPAVAVAAAVESAPSTSSASAAPAQTGSSVTVAPKTEASPSVVIAPSITVQTGPVTVNRE